MKKLNVEQLENVNGGHSFGDYYSDIPSSTASFFESQSEANQEATHQWMNDRMQQYNN